VLLLADTHLGFDLPVRPRIERPRRGPDFFANFERALRPARQGEVDLVVHGGDLFFRSKVPAGLVEMALAPLVRVAGTGVPVYLVPGNHERSRIPLHLWTAHPNLHIFDYPRTFVLAAGGSRLALAGFPFARRVRDQFERLVRETGYEREEADVRLLCIHQIVEGARVGVHDFTFRSGPDVVRGSQIPGGFCAVLSGHIHRAQVLRHDLGRRPLAAPVLYPGAVERTGFDERLEEKGYMIVTVDLGAPGGRLEDVAFVRLPARPMVSLAIETGKLGGEAVADHVGRRLSELDPESVVRVALHGSGAARAREALGAATLRKLAPEGMIVMLSPYRRQSV
jgi:DNA repair exonuclease SbcCD nuclease subunit